MTETLAMPRHDPPDVTGPPLYVVGGYARGGTSMMMQALAAAGMDCRRASPEQSPERHELWELTPEQYVDEEFPPAELRGCVIKALRMAPAKWGPQPGGMKLIWMMRSPQAAAASFKARFPFRRPQEPDEIYFNSLVIVAALQNRPDTAVMPISYEGVLVEPMTVFERIRLFFRGDEGLPDLDGEAFCTAVDPTLRHF